MRELGQNPELTRSLKQDSRMLQINMGQSNGYQVLVEADATAFIGSQYHFNSEAVINALGELLDEFAKKQPIIGSPNNLPRSGVIAFIGRDEILTELHSQLQHSDRIAITAVQGMGGIGKTELALQYVIASLGQSVYPGGICWLRARGQEIATQIVSFAKAHLGMKPIDDMEASEQVAFTWQRWPEGNSLVVIDDVTDYGAIEPYLPPSNPRFKVLITTRQNFGASVKAISIEELSDDNAINLLKSIVGAERIESQMKEAEALCKWVGNLPLGLELLGRFLVRKQDWAIAKLLERLESQRLAAKALLERESGMTATLGVAAALELSWIELSAPEQDLACLLGMFAVAPFPWNLVEQCFPEVDPDELEELRDEGLRDRSLIKRVGEGRYQIHQVVQEYLREKLRQNERNMIAIKTAFGRVMVAQAKILDYTSIIEQIDEMRGVIVHLEETAEQWLQVLSEKNVHWPFVGIGNFYDVQGNYELAEPWRLKSLIELKKILGNDHPDIAQRLDDLAILYFNQERYEEAEPLYLQVLELRKKVFGSDNLHVATSLNNLAVLYSDQGRYEEAEPLYLQVLELRKKVLGNDHLDVAQSLNNLAALYFGQGRYEEAETLYLQALELRKKMLGSAHPDVAQSLSLNNLAVLYSGQRRYEKAETLYLQALELRKKALGNDHPDVAITQWYLGKDYQKRGRYGDAETLYRQALAIAEAKLGTNHPKTKGIRNNLKYLPWERKSVSVVNIMSIGPREAKLLWPAK
jgi:tetratricopeptide (TPR) repeat protein